MRREKKTVEAMLRIYCRRNHDGIESPCSECRELLTYSRRRLDSCPLMENKPTCAKCTTHCYEKNHRDRMRVVMRYSGPRMILRHPALAILHIVDGLKKPRRPMRIKASGPKI